MNNNNNTVLKLSPLSSLKYRTIAHYYMSTEMSVFFYKNNIIGMGGVNEVCSLFSSNPETNTITIYRHSGA